MVRYKIEHSFEKEDHVYIEKASSVTMLYYASNRGKFQCPCLWKKEYGTVIDTHGNYIYCKHDENPTRISAFYYRDVQLVE